MCSQFQRCTHVTLSNYSGLIAALGSYRDMVHGQDYISREVANCLYFLNVTLLGACFQADATTSSGERIFRARQECSALIAEILMPESLSDV